MESVMSITDAIVQNINKTSAARSYQQEDLFEAVTSDLDSSFLLSPTSHKGHTSRNLLEESLKGDEQNAPNLFQMLVDGDHDSSHKSSPRDILNSSLFSNVSLRSHASTTTQGSSSFFSGQAQKVKVSAKLLKEIKSPFSDDVPIPYVEKHISDRSGVTEVHHVAPVRSCEYLSDDSNVTASVHSSCSQDVINIISPFSMRSRSSAGGKSSVTEPTSSVNFNLNNHSNRKIPSKRKLAQGSFESGSDQDASLLMSKSQAEDLKPSEEPKSQQSGKDIWNTGLSTEESNGQGDILTVQAHDVSASASETSGTGSNYVASSETNKAASVTSSSSQRYDKYHPSVLKQGSLSSGGQAQLPQQDLQITCFAVQHAQRTARDVLSKKQQSGTAPKRVVQPRLVQKEVKVKSSQNNKSTMDASDPVMAAAVAASAAVAATQPFLRAQEAMEQRMADILSQISNLQDRGKTLINTATSYDSGLATSTEPLSEVITTGQEVSTWSKSQKLQRLEQQVQDMTQQRLDHLERLQERQTAVQAQLLKMSRQPSHPTDYLDVMAAANQPALVTSPAHRPHSKSRPDPSFNHSPPTHDAGVFDTPAPRRNAPVPMSFPLPAAVQAEPNPSSQERNFKSGRLLETILASQDSPGKTWKSPASAVHRSPSMGKHHALEAQTAALVQELDDLRAEHRRSDGRQKLTSPTAPLKRSPVHHIGPGVVSPPYEPLVSAPIDAYMMKAPVDSIPSSPYPDLQDLRNRKKTMAANAPVQANYADAQGVLRDVKKLRSNLETNLQTICRSRQETDIFNMLSNGTHKGALTDEDKIRRMVESRIDSMNVELEREIIEEMTKLKEAAKKTHFMIPERDTSTTKANLRAQPSSTASKSKISMGSRVKPRVNTGLQRALPPASTGSKLKIPLRAKPAPKPVAKPAASSVRPQTIGSPTRDKAAGRIFGKQPYEGKRTTNNKQPYLHFNSPPTSPKSSPKVAAPQTRQDHVSGTRFLNKAISISPSGHAVSAHMPQADHFYFDPVTGGARLIPGLSSGPMAGHLVPMAIPLGKPRQEAGGPVPPPFLASPSTRATPQGGALPGSTRRVSGMEPIVTSTPMFSPIGRGVNFTAEDETGEEDGLEPKGIKMEPNKPNLTTQALPGVNIESEEPDSPDPPGLPEGYEVDKVSPISFNKYLAVEDLDEDDSSVQEEHSVSGSEGTQKPYFGPAFPPPAAPLPQTGPTSDVVAADIKRRDILQDHATQWVEQELMARMLSEMAAKQPERPRQLIGNFPSTDPALRSGDISPEQPSFVAETLGQAGLQLFVDAGLDVDEDMVNALMQEVILDCAASMMGQRDTEKAIQVPARRAPARQAAEEPMLVQGVSGQYEQRERDEEEGTVATPIATPKILSPREDGKILRASSVPARVMTPPPTPVWTPPSSPPSAASKGRQPGPDLSHYEDITEPVAPALAQPAKEQLPEPPQEEISETVDLMPHILDAATQPVDIASPRQFSHHSVDTPPCSPTTLPLDDDDVYTPEPSERESTPPPVLVHAATSVDEQLLEPTPAPEPPQPTLQPARSPPRSPEPWGNPESVMSDERPDSEPDHQQPPPTIDNQVPRGWTQPLPVQPAQVTQERAIGTSPPPRSPDSSISETINECVSEGQWLISVQSEGEVHQLPVAPGLFGGVMASAMQLGDDTLHDMQDLEDDGGNLASEGEVLLRYPRSVNQDARLNLMMQVNQQPVNYIEQQLLANQMAQAQVMRVQGQSRVQPQVVPGISAPTQVSFGPTNGDNRNAVGRMSSNDFSLGEVRVVSPAAPPAMRISEVRGKGGLVAGPVRSTSNGAPNRGRRGKPQVPARKSLEEMGVGPQGGDTFGAVAESADTLHGTNTMDSLDSRAMTPDQMRLDLNSLLASQEYMTTLSSTSEVSVSHSRVSTHTQLFTGTQSAGHLPAIYDDDAEDEDEVRSSRQEMHTTGTIRASTEYTQSEGQQAADSEAEDLEATGSEAAYTLSAMDTNSNAELRQYLDSLEATNNLAQEVQAGHTLERNDAGQQRKLSHTGPLTVSVTIPSVDQSDNEEESAEEISEISINEN